MKLQEKKSIVCTISKIRSIFIFIGKLSTNHRLDTLKGLIYHYVPQKNTRLSSLVIPSGPLMFGGTR
jgi:hypothetical protein